MDARLRQWFFYRSGETGMDGESPEESFRIAGFVYGSREVHDGSFGTTRPIAAMETFEEGLVAETVSGKRYLLPLDELKQDHSDIPGEDDTLRALAFYGIPAEHIQQIAQLSERAFAKRLLEMNSRLSAGELYVRLDHDEALEGFFKKAEGEVSFIRPHPHIGTFIDSMLVEKGEVQFKYYMRGEIEPYRISENILKLTFENTGSETRFRPPEWLKMSGISCALRVIPIPEGGIVSILKEEFEDPGAPIWQEENPFSQEEINRLLG